MTDHGLTQWAMGAQAGEMKAYYTGYLPYAENGEGEEARDLFNAGYVLLVQRRLNNFVYAYFAIKKADLKRPFNPTLRECFWQGWERGK